MSQNSAMSFRLTFVFSKKPQLVLNTGFPQCFSLWLLCSVKKVIIKYLYILSNILINLLLYISQLRFFTEHSYNHLRNELSISTDFTNSPNLDIMNLGSHTHFNLLPCCYVQRFMGFLTPLENPPFPNFINLNHGTNYV